MGAALGALLAVLTARMRDFVLKLTTLAAGEALSVLPLSHIFERTGFYIFCYSGVSVYYCSSFDQVGEHLREVRPTVMTAVEVLLAPSESVARAMMI